MNFRSKELSLVSSDIVPSSQSKGGNDARDRINLSHKRSVDGFGKNGGSPRQPVAEHPTGLATKYSRLTGGALSKLTAVQAERPVHVGSLQSTCPVEYEAGKL